MDKLTMAHEYAIALLNSGCENMQFDRFVQLCWEYADLMQAEADKRLNLSNSKPLEEWQPDWSVAPDEYKWAGVTTDHEGKIAGTIFFVSKPDVASKSVYSYYIGGGEAIFNEATFNYQGSWQNSLRKRPEGK